MWRWAWKTTNRLKYNIKLWRKILRIGKTLIFFVATSHDSGCCVIPFIFFLCWIRIFKIYWIIECNQSCSSFHPVNPDSIVIYSKPTNNTFVIKESRHIRNRSPCRDWLLANLFFILVWGKVNHSSSGGFYISKEQQKQPIINIVEAIDGKQIFRSCGLGLSKCSSSHPCPIHNDYKKARDIIEKLFRQKRVMDLCEPVTNGLAYLMG